MSKAHPAVKPQPQNIPRSGFPRQTQAPSQVSGDSASTTADSSQPLATNSACGYLTSAIERCESLTPGFTSLHYTDQTRCLCYSSLTWNPYPFDSAVLTCAEFAYTASSSLYSDLQQLEGFCDTSTSTAGSSNSTSAATLPAASTTVELTSASNPNPSASNGNSGGQSPTSTSSSSAGSSPNTVTSQELLAEIVRNAGSRP